MSTSLLVPVMISGPQKCIGKYTLPPHTHSYIHFLEKTITTTLNKNIDVLLFLHFHEMDLKI